MEFHRYGWRRPPDVAAASLTGPSAAVIGESNQIRIPMGRATSRAGEIAVADANRRSEQPD